MAIVPNQLCGFRIDRQNYIRLREREREATTDAPSSNNTPLIPLTPIPHLVPRRQLLPPRLLPRRLFILDLIHSQNPSFVLFTGLFSSDGDTGYGDGDDSKGFER